MQTRRLLTDDVSERLKRFIVDNELKSGDRLPSESALAEQLGVSKSLIREVIRILQGEGIVQARRGIGLFVKEIQLVPRIEQLKILCNSDSKTILDLIDARLAVEVGAARLVVESVTPDCLAKMRQNVEASFRCIEDGQHCIRSLDEEFHQLYISSLDGRILREFVGVINEFFAELESKMDRGQHSTESRARHAADEHRAICEAIEARNVSSLRSIMEVHLLRQRQRFA